MQEKCYYNLIKRIKNEIEFKKKIRQNEINTKKQENALSKLSPIIDEYSSVIANKLFHTIYRNNVECHNRNAKQVLIDFLKTLKRFKSISCIPFPHLYNLTPLFYIGTLIKIEKAYKVNDFPLICHELYTLIYNENFLYKNIKNNIEKQLERILSNDITG